MPSTKSFRKRRATRKTLGIVDKKHSLSLLLFNTRGLSQSSFADIKIAVERENVDIVVITETHYRQEQSIKHNNLDGFKIYEARRSDGSEDKNGGGVLIYCKTAEGLMMKQFKPNVENDNLSFVNKERVWVLCDSVGYKTAVCGVYFGCQFNDDSNAMYNSLMYSVILREQALLRKKGYRTVIMGDMNGHVGNVAGVGIVGNKPKINPNGRQLLSFLEDAEMQMFKEIGKCSTHVCLPLASGIWTRQVDNSSSVIDYVLISKEHESTVDSMTIDDSTHGFGGDSDHNMIFVKLKDYFVVKSLISGLLIQKPTWNIKEDQDFSQYSDLLDKYSKYVDKSCVNSFAGSLSSVIHRSMRESIGLKNPNPQKRNDPLPSNILKELACRRLLSKEWKVLQSQHERDKQSVPDAKASETLNSASSRLLNQRDKVLTLLAAHNKCKRKVNIQSCIGNSKKAIQNFWSYVTDKEKKTSSINSVFNEKSGVLKCSSEDILLETVMYVKDLFHGKFTKFTNNDNIPTPPNDHLYCSNNPNVPPPSNSGSNSSDHNYSSISNPVLSSTDNSESVEFDPIGFMNSSFDVSEIISAVALLKSNKAKGWDDIPNECLIHCSKSFKYLLCELFNKIKNDDSIPFGWNHGRLVLVHKRGPVETISNYRPLTVNISIMSLYSRVLNQRLTNVVEEHNLLHEIQGGFRKNRSGSDNNFVLNTIIWKARAEGKEVHKAYVDIHKAYDSVNRRVLWAKLRKLNFGESFISCLKNLYKDDCIQTEVHGLRSEKVFLSRGVRQGCSLSPILFALYISDMGFDLANSCHGFMLMDTRISALFFADDILLIARTSNGLNALLLIVHKHCEM